MVSEYLYCLHNIYVFLFVYLLLIYFLYIKSTFPCLILFCYFIGFRYSRRYFIYREDMILHTPVLLNEVCSFLRPESKLIVDCTLGHGGHAMTLLSLAKDATLIGFDVDELMLKKAKARIKSSILKDTSSFEGKEDKKQDKKENNKIAERTEYVHDSYANIVSVLN